MKKTVMILAVVLAVSVGTAFVSSAYAQSASDLQEKAKAAEETMKEKMAKPGDQKTTPAATSEQKPAAPGKAGKPMPKEGPCGQIVDICKNAGFKGGDWARGDGLEVHCVNPIMQHKTVVPGAKKPLPTVDPKLVSDCKKGHPGFGAGQVGTPGRR